MADSNGNGVEETYFMDPDVEDALEGTGRDSQVAALFAEATEMDFPAIGNIVDAVSRRAGRSNRMVLDGDGPDADSGGNFSSVSLSDEGDGRFFRHEGSES